MGVPGLWDLLRPAAEPRSLTNLAVVDGFEQNPGGRRGLRVGIDASIWFYHATYGREGENPELRTLFFRCAKLLGKPFLPLFVFDGPLRPELKREKRISGNDHWLVSGMKSIIEAFGFEWRTAPGEAEAELAYLNKIGVIDAIVTDDVDTFVFGATKVIRNYGKLLTGNNGHPIKNATGKDDGEHTYTYSSTKILSHPSVGLTREGLILIAILCGGDYDPVGLRDCGPNVAYGLAKCGFGESLVQAARTLSRTKLEDFLETWRDDVCLELKTNSRGFLPTKKIKLSQSIDDTFPNIDVLMLYVKPVTSENTVLNTGNTSQAKCASFDYKWDREPNLMKLADLCEQKFEWGYKEMIIKRFRTIIWGPTVLRILRHAVLEGDNKGPATPTKKHKHRIIPGTPSRMITKHFSSQSIDDEDEDSSDGEEKERLIIGIRGKRAHASTDGVPEYRLEIMPAQFVRLAESGIRGQRQPPTKASDFRVVNEGSDSDEVEEDDDDDDEGKSRGREPNKAPPSPTSSMRVWMPACMVSLVEPSMVKAYEEKVSKKARDKEDRERRKAAKASLNNSPSHKKKGSHSRSRQRKPAATSSSQRTEVSEEELSAEEDFSDVFGLLPGKGKGKNKSVGKSSSRLRKNLDLSIVEENDEESDKEVRSAPKEIDPWQSFKSQKPLVNRELLSKETKALHSAQDKSTSRSYAGSILDVLDSHESSSHRKMTKTSTNRLFSRTTSANAILSGSYEGESSESEALYNNGTTKRERAASVQPGSKFSVKPFPMLSSPMDDEEAECTSVFTPSSNSVSLSTSNTVPQGTDSDSDLELTLEGFGKHNSGKYSSQLQVPSIQSAKTKSKGTKGKNRSTSSKPLVAARMKRDKTHTSEIQTKNFNYTKANSRITLSKVDTRHAIDGDSDDSVNISGRKSEFAKLPLETTRNRRDPTVDDNKEHYSSNANAKDISKTIDNFFEKRTSGVIVILDSSESEQEFTTELSALDKPPTTIPKPLLPDLSSRMRLFKDRGNVETQKIDDLYPSVKRGKTIPQRTDIDKGLKSRPLRPRAKININMDDIIDLT